MGIFSHYYSSKKELRNYISRDRNRYNYTLRSYIKGLFFNEEGSQALRLLKAYRECRYAYKRRSKTILHKFIFFAKLWYFNHLQFKYDTYISIDSEIGPGLWIPHLGGIIINCKKMGENCSVTKGVIIGNRAGQGNRAIIGNECYFTLGAKIIGAVNIGDNVIIAQNAVVTTDVESNSIAGGIPARIVKKFNDFSEINL